jgi:TRAP-type C4-dicarboxylate transport system substrate-binding protein
MLALAAAALLVLAGTSPLSAQEHIIKFASLAPEGSTWLNVMREYDAAVRKESGGRLGFRIYPGGVQGEDKDVLRKIRLGQLHSAGLTGFGLGEIAPKLRILDAPFLFRNAAEVDHLYATLDEEFRKALSDNNYVLLGWAEVGFVYVFTSTPVRTPKDMNGVKMWMWEGDPVAEATFSAFGINPIPLSVVDVLTSLQTGLINGAYTSPLAAIALQWYTRVKYMMDLPLANASGAVVISRKAYEALPPDLREILSRNGRTYMAKLTARSREENTASLATLKKNGIQAVSVSGDAAVKEYAEAGRKARLSLVGRLYDKPFLDRVEKVLADFRTTMPPR